MLKLSSILTLSALGIRSADAGSRLWEAPLHYNSVEEPVEIRLSHEGNNVTIFGVDTSSVTGNTTAGGNNNDKRWITIQNGGSNRLLSSYRWPEKTIRFHYENQESKDRLSTYLDAAKALWATAGLPEDFRYVEVESEDAYQAKKGQILLISYNDENFLATSLGRPTEDDDGPSPRMRLCPSTTIGTLDIVANFAHELGHAWGLHHEHQNPQFWASPYTEAKGNRVEFGDGHGTFNCALLSDYQRTRQRLIAENGQTPGERLLASACRSRSKAVLHGFRGATEWLPLDYQEDFVASSKSFDKKSIMLYPSQAGGVGGVTGGTDNRASVLLFKGGEKLAFNTMPSAQDVEGIKKLYGVKRKAFLPFLSESSSASNSRFEKVRGKDEGQTCDNAAKRWD